MKLVTTNTQGRITVNKIIIATIIFLSSLTLMAQDKPAAAAADKGKKKVVVNFENGELVDGANPSPEVEFIFERANFNYKRLIRLREHFIPEANSGREGFGQRD